MYNAQGSRCHKFDDIALFNQLSIVNFFFLKF